MKQLSLKGIVDITSRLRLRYETHDEYQVENLVRTWN